MMYNMIIKMSLVTATFVSFSIMLWIMIGENELSKKKKIGIGIFYGLCAIFSTHFGINYGNMMLNVRDLAPLIAGLFFDPLSGLIAGFIGGIERYIVGTYFNVGAYTTIACSVSTCLAGFLALFLNKIVLEGKKPDLTYALFFGAVMEVFHMYAVIITHRDDMRMAFKVVNICSIPMIVFTAIGLAATSIVFSLYIGGFRNPFKKIPKEERSIADTFQNALLLAMVILMAISSFTTYLVLTQGSYQYASNMLSQSEYNIVTYYNEYEEMADNLDVGIEGIYVIYGDNGMVNHGVHKGETIPISTMKYIESQLDKKYFEYQLYGVDSLCRATKLIDGKTLLIMASMNEMFWYRNIEAYESGFSAILLFTVMYLFIAFMVKTYITDNLDKVNASLEKITSGHLDERVEVRESSEFVSLSDDINETVESLKGYIAKEKLRIDKELKLAKAIQQSALPRNFIFKDRDEFDVYAMMEAAKEVGGDFYDFFFIDSHTIAFAVADVSGKGIPGAMFMMRAKTAIRSFAANSQSPGETLFKASNTLCEGNEEDMFVTAWLGFLDLKTGVLKCANYAHEFPVIMRANGDYEVFEDEHTLPLASYENIKPKEYELKLEAGDRVFLYTDGIPEAINQDDEQYGMERLIKALNRIKNDDIMDRLSEIRQDVATFVNGTEQFDDITLLEFEFKGYLKA